ncbi:MAG TPA: CAP domain-containing protein [Planctomycetota bacterium]|nr:CAP domain-containing protein [Planctomycetota bacterium]
MTSAPTQSVGTPAAISLASTGDVNNGTGGTGVPAPSVAEGNPSAGPSSTGSTGGTGTGTGTGTGGTTGTGPNDSVLQQCLQRINQDRAGGGLGPLTLDASLTAVAQQHTVDFANCSNLNPLVNANCAHQDFAAGNTGGAFSENQGWALSTNQVAAFNTVETAMMQEGAPPTGQDNHYANIMDPNRTKVGIGIVTDPAGYTYMTEDFE